MKIKKSNKEVDSLYNYLILFNLNNLNLYLIVYF